MGGGGAVAARNVAHWRREARAICSRSKSLKSECSKKAMNVEGDDGNLRYLQAELARIDVLLRREVRRWVLAGQDPNDDYRGLYVTQLEAQQLLDRPFG